VLLFPLVSKYGHTHANYNDFWESHLQGTDLPLGRLPATKKIQVKGEGFCSGEGSQRDTGGETIVLCWVWNWKSFPGQQFWKPSSYPYNYCFIMARCHHDIIRTPDISRWWTIIIFAHTTVVEYHLIWWLIIIWGMDQNSTSPLDGTNMYKQWTESAVSWALNCWSIPMWHSPWKSCASCHISWEHAPKFSNKDSPKAMTRVGSTLATNLVGVQPLFNGLVPWKIYRKAPYSMGKSMVSG